MKILTLALLAAGLIACLLFNRHVIGPEILFAALVAALLARKES